MLNTYTMLHKFCTSILVLVNKNLQFQNWKNRKLSTTIYMDILTIKTKEEDEREKNSNIIH